MRELTFDECEMVAGGSRFGAFFRGLKAFFAGVAAAFTAEQLDEATDEPPEAPPSSFDPTSETFTTHGPAWGQDANGNFQSGQYWATADGVTYYDMDMDGYVDGAMYTDETGTTWHDRGLTGTWGAVN